MSRTMFLFFSVFLFASVASAGKRVHFTMDKSNPALAKGSFSISCQATFPGGHGSTGSSGNISLGDRLYYTIDGMIYQCENMLNSGMHGPESSAYMSISYSCEHSGKRSYSFSGNSFAEGENQFLLEAPEGCQ